MSDISKPLARQVVETYTRQGMTLAAAESLTAGMIAAAVGDVPGASAVLMGGVVSYDPDIKRRVLGVSRQIIDTQGVVSEPCALQMAVGVRELMRADVAVSATGVAGPGGGTPENPVGTVWLGVSSARGAFAKRCTFTGSRRDIREQTVTEALRLALQQAQQA